MGRKMDDADVKKECPSCGLGVALDAKICEFCGWDFDEEDEWILQIEKLERDLVLEKQKFEPGTVGSRIEASLHSPMALMKEHMKASAAKAKLQQQMEEVLGTPEEKREPPKPTAPPKTTRVVREATREEVHPIETKEEPPIEAVRKEPEPVETQATASPQSGKVRRIRKVKGAQPTISSSPHAETPKGKTVKKGKE